MRKDYTDYKAQIVRDLMDKMQSVERNYRAFKQEWERLNQECATLVNEGWPISYPGLQENHNNRHATFERMQELDAESTALLLAIQAINGYK